LLAFKNGKSVKTKADWLKRRAEIKAMFDEDVYGKYPAHIPKVTWHLDGTENLTVEGIAVVAKHLTGHVDNSSYPAISIAIKMDVVTPASARGHRVPVIIGGGTLPRPDAPPRRMPSGMSIIMGPPTDSSAKQLLQKGWGFVSVNASQVQADNGAGLTSGIIGLVNKGQPRKMDDWGVLRAWAWADSRAMDYFETDKSVDAHRVAIEGLSRYGKAALVTMAYDPRFAIAFIASSGEAGAKILRRNYGEQVENVAASGEYHWMAGNFLKYAGPLRADDLPVDAHELVALCAPRPVFISGGTTLAGDGWADAKGTFLAEVGAGPVYRLLGKKDLGTAEFPPTETPLVNGDLAFRSHSGGHTTGPNWPMF